MGSSDLHTSFHEPPLSSCLSLLGRKTLQRKNVWIHSFTSNLIKNIPRHKNWACENDVITHMLNGMQLCGKEMRPLEVCGRESSTEAENIPPMCIFLSMKRNKVLMFQIPSANMLVISLGSLPRK